MTPTPRSQEAYAEAQAQARALVAQIQAELDRHQDDRQAESAPLWGHVTYLHELMDLLQPVIAHINCY